MDAPRSGRLSEHRPGERECQAATQVRKQQSSFVGTKGGLLIFVNPTPPACESFLFSQNDPLFPWKERIVLAKQKALASRRGGINKDEQASLCSDKRRLLLSHLCCCLALSLSWSVL